MKMKVKRNEDITRVLQLALENGCRVVTCCMSKHRSTLGIVVRPSRSVTCRHATQVADAMPT